MKKYTVLALFAAIMAVGGTLAANGLSATPFFIAQSAKTLDSNMPITGHVTMVVTDPNGNVKAYRQMDNIVVNAGETCTGARLFGDQLKCSGTAFFNYIGIGTDATAEAAAQSALIAETNTRQQDTTNTLTNSSGPGATSVLAGTFAFTSTQSIQESGLFDTSSINTGHMFARKTISPAVNVANGDSLTVTWTVTTGS